jgi:hypothetical protein
MHNIPAADDPSGSLPDVCWEKGEISGLLRRQELENLRLPNIGSRIAPIVQLLGLPRLISPAHGICATYTPKRYDCTQTRYALA